MKHFDSSKTLLEILGVSGKYSSKNSPWNKPLNQLSSNETLELLKKSGDAHLVPIAIGHLSVEDDNHDLLVVLLNQLGYPWNEEEVRLMRSFVDRMISDLNEWDGNETIQMEAMILRSSILEVWANWEKSLSIFKEKGDDPGK
ncbi:hypothetical protein M2103_001697 [Ereboglobus sp. PH5-5]|uniref:hypothetical protein n=1 Tax=Ereboglobus sp. PH5-5 TaxID=2940529 RepID=UPI002406AFF7|nr:hypothetical protein [Ereboglobus sp. PH5-5]MDF9833473.1 hypothetical protein [Ereboglobus sp. PH5-5]